MALTPEGKVKKRVREVLHKYDAYWHSPVQNGMGTPSLDFICCIAGKYFGIETKAGNKKPTPRQEMTMEAITNAGGKVFVVNEVEGLEELDAWICLQVSNKEK
jgi:hypothetical protein